MSKQQREMAAAHTSCVFAALQFVHPEAHTHKTPRLLYLDAFIVHVSKSAELNLASVQVTSTHTYTDTYTDS